jgi:uncharacterized protein (DUF433 family)
MSTASDSEMIVRQLDQLRDQLRQLQRLIETQPQPTEVDASTGHPHITRDVHILGSEPIIKGTHTPVRAIVEHWKFGDSPEEIASKLPHLRLAHIFDALSYYDDHRDEIEKAILLNRVQVND